MTFSMSLKCGTLLVNCLIITFYVWAERCPTKDEYCPLCDYVYFDDGYFSYTYLSKQDHSTDLGIPVTTYMINMTSQKWKNESWSDTPIWWHYVAVNVPTSIQFPEHGFLYISSGSNDPDTHSLDTEHLVATAHIASDLGIVTAVVFQIPNQPIVYQKDTTKEPRYEDDSVSWTWDYFMSQDRDRPPADPEVILQVPMCKGAVKAMDLMENVANVDLQIANISKFMVSGLSKRGWTTWLLGPIDDRVVAMAPATLMALNMRPSYRHYYTSFVGWPLHVWDYWKRAITTHVAYDPEALALIQVVDPYSYRQWMDLPKLVIAAASDEFFLLDDSHYFWEDLPGEKYFWLIENSGHDLESSSSGQAYWDMLQDYYRAVITKYKKPVFSWKRHASTERTGKGSIAVFTDQPPSYIQAWSALSVVPDRRDWRLIHVRCDHVDDACVVNATGIMWKPKDVDHLGAGHYYVEYDAPTEGFLAFFIKLEFPGQLPNRKFIFSTEAVVLPNHMPYTDCQGRNCTGVLK